MCISSSHLVAQLLAGALGGVGSCFCPLSHFLLHLLRPAVGLHTLEWSAVNVHITYVGNYESLVEIVLPESRSNVRD